MEIGDITGDSMNTALAAIAAQCTKLGAFDKLTVKKDFASINDQTLEKAEHGLENDQLVYCERLEEGGAGSALKVGRLFRVKRVDANKIELSHQGCGLTSEGTFVKEKWDNVGSPVKGCDLIRVVELSESTDAPYKRVSLSAFGTAASSAIINGGVYNIEGKAGSRAAATAMFDSTGVIRQFTMLATPKIFGEAAETVEGISLDMRV